MRLERSSRCSRGQAQRTGVKALLRISHLPVTASEVEVRESSALCEKLDKSKNEIKTCP